MGYRGIESWRNIGAWEYGETQGQNGNKGMKNISA